MIIDGIQIFKKQVNTNNKKRFNYKGFYKSIKIVAKVKGKL